MTAKDNVALQLLAATTIRSLEADANCFGCVAKTLYDPFLSRFFGMTKEPLSGIGDDAISVTMPGPGTGLIFKKGDSVFKCAPLRFPARLDQGEGKDPRG